jgi:Na+/melibiose symporter-like transporter
VGFIGFIDGLNNFLTGIGLVGFQWPEDAPTSAFSLFNAGGIIAGILGIVISKKLADRFGKRDVFGAALFLASLCLLAFYFFAPSSIALVFGFQILHGFFYGVTTPLLWAMIADVADYSEWRNNRRATAIIFSAMIFGLKAGLSIGGALVAGILATFGYDEQLAVQSDGAIHGIQLSVSVLPTITFMVAIGCLFFYEINKKMENRIERELLERRGNGTNA